VNLTLFHLGSSEETRDEKRLLTKDEAYEQISHSASLFKAILEYTGKLNNR